MTGEEAALEVLRKRQLFAKLRKRVAAGDRSPRLVHEVEQQYRELAKVFCRFDGPPRATWSSLLHRYEALQSQLHAELVPNREGAR
jgi:hypothetical protein